jgi:receptor-type tyrosine-protein phosphatase gamma
MYWPKDLGPDAKTTYGFIEVQLEREQALANYTVRTMKIKHLKVRRRKQGKETPMNGQLSKRIC